MPHLSHFLLALVSAYSNCAVSTADFGTRLAPGEKLKKQLGSTELQIVHRKRSDSRQQLPAARLAFDKDVRVAGNNLPAGVYDIELKVIAKHDVHLIFRSGDKESLRVSVRPKELDEVRKKAIRLEVEEPPPPQEGRRRRRRQQREPSAEIHFEWSGRRATLPLQMSGVLWRSTEPPKMPTELHQPWAIVHSSLMGFVHQSMDEHVEHFADNFESDWDDGGSQEAHMQMIGRMLYEGEFEDSVLKLDQLKWEQEDGRIKFRGIVVLAPSGPSPLAYTVENTDQDWKIIHLDGPKL